MWKAIGLVLLAHGQMAAAPEPAATADEPAGPPMAPPAVFAPTAMANISFRNDVGRWFDLIDVRFVLDGKELPVSLTGTRRGQSYIIFTGVVAPGRHTITSHLSYRGHNRGVFSYLRGYTFNLNAEETLAAFVGGTANATIVGKENRGFNVPYEKRLAVTIEPTFTAYKDGVARASLTTETPAR